MGNRGDSDNLAMVMAVCRDLSEDSTISFRKDSVAAAPCLTSLEVSISSIGSQVTAQPHSSTESPV